jgi:hypothetical protein
MRMISFCLPNFEQSSGRGYPYQKRLHNNAFGVRFSSMRVEMTYMKMSLWTLEVEEDSFIIVLIHLFLYGKKFTTSAANTTFMRR